MHFNQQLTHECMVRSALLMANSWSCETHYITYIHYETFTLKLLYMTEHIIIDLQKGLSHTN